MNKAETSMLVLTKNQTQGHWFQPPGLSPLSYDNQTTISTSQSSIYTVQVVLKYNIDYF